MQILSCFLASKLFLTCWELQLCFLHGEHQLVVHVCCITRNDKVVLDSKVWLIASSAMSQVASLECLIRSTGLPLHATRTLLHDTPPSDAAPLHHT